ncbi:MAG TPA: PhoU domain-containing protein [Thermoplasmata archaeon]|jgi:phosphate uptake regulator|nr:PhoU domain-containing protein [Thermoplasmata archaeon]
MEARKLQKTGGSTYTLSLPKKWVLASKLAAGDAVFVDELADGTLALRPHPVASPSGRAKVLDAPSGEVRDHLLRKLIGAYISGYNVIEIRFKPDDGPSVRRVARDFTRMVIGPEILEESRTSLMLQDLSNPAEMDAERTLRRMYMTARAMHEDALEVLRTRDEALAKDVEQRDEDVDRLYWMIAKQYSLAHLAGPTTAADWRATGVHNYRLVAKLLERIADHAERIASAVSGLKGDLDPRLLKDMKSASDAAVSILDDAFRALMGKDTDLANAAVDRAAGLQKLVDALTHRVATRKGEELLALGAIVDSIQRTGSYATDIAETAINHVLAQED